jgi:hypothetical protein
MVQLRLVSDPADRWFCDGHLVAIPARRGKRIPILNRLAQEFEIGVRYSECEVNDALRAFHADTAALRRYLIDEGFMTRTAGGAAYWRCGGDVQFSSS